MYKILIRPVLFKLDPEKVHTLLVSFLRIPLISKVLSVIYNRQNQQLQTTVFGLTFRNRVGLAAGFDKNAEVVDQIADLGFGFIEIGTVTPKAQPGNDKPRIFRLPKDSALINRMGFNNHGAERIRKRMISRKSKILVGGNIGKNKVTANENAGNDYRICFDSLFEVVDYFVVNVSSPNTPGLRELQEKEPLKKILTDLQKQNSKRSSRKPILLKIAPDLENQQLDDIIEIILSTGIDGLIATNTTISRDNLRTNQTKINDIGAGGLSGKPLRDRSTAVIRYLVEKSNGQFPIIAVGGIHSAEDAIEKLNAGASLIQLYTGFIYEGPSLIKKINKRILADKKRL
jgi:dihydroorotate dehydrogenase